MSFQFDSLMDLLTMSGHGSYVWASYIITFMALGVLIILPHLKQRQILIRLKRQERIEKQDRPEQRRP